MMYILRAVDLLVCGVPFCEWICVLKSRLNRIVCLLQAEMWNLITHFEFSLDENCVRIFMHWQFCSAQLSCVNCLSTILELAATQAKFADVEAKLSASSQELEASRGELREKHKGLVEFQDSSEEKERQMQSLSAQVSLQDVLRRSTNFSCVEVNARLRDSLFTDV